MKLNKEDLLLKYSGKDSELIFAIEDELRNDGWDISFYEFSMDENTMKVDFIRKTIKANIAKAYLMKEYLLKVVEKIEIGDSVELILGTN